MNFGRGHAYEHIAWQRQGMAFVCLYHRVGGAVALIALFPRPGKQCSDKTMQLPATFRASHSDQEIEHWKEIYHGTREAASAPAGHFISRTGKSVPLVSMMAGDNEDHTAIQCMAESLERVCV